ncbi:hypothetical protein [Sphaerotilus microaerophilus]|uniref:Uncharacterized protein n=1 Tax=Sphaerotilus microaerophilus TaxID=2914710 RepID=A0ABM7YQT8_9BURK|nr:hypothetical protein [Sphaerotilus sp. FB-5]BDI06876.1 hypothetical protein CATMQ487_38460 [Sphaerotilus sp. FB-5]
MARNHALPVPHRRGRAVGPALDPLRTLRREAFIGRDRQGNAGLRRCWWGWACQEEHINPKAQPLTACASAWIRWWLAATAPARA